MASHPAYKYIKRMEGPFGYIRICTLCKPGPKQFTVMIRKGQGGFIMGNKANGTMIQHIKEVHPDVLWA